MTTTTNTKDTEHKELGNTIREALKVLGIGTNDATLLAYESICDAANAVVQAGIDPGQTTVSVAAFDEAKALRDEMSELIRAHKVTINKVFNALNKVTR
jgi:hypothetical protein